MRTLLRHVAVVSESAALSAGEMLRICGALQKQVTRDFTPLWDINATVSPFAALKDVPSDYWPILVRDDIHTPGAAGIHLDKNGQPFALVQAGRDVSLTIAHEMIEMLVDPFGNRMVAGPSPMPGQGRVNFLVEACDPCESKGCAYPVNGVLVSDFYTPSYFDPVTVTGTRYSFSGKITMPRQVLEGGYLSWMDPGTDDWWQLVWPLGGRPGFRSLGPLGRRGRRSGGVRGVIDRLSAGDHRALGLKRASSKAAPKAASAATGRGGPRGPAPSGQPLEFEQRARNLFAAVAAVNKTHDEIVQLVIEELQDSGWAVSKPDENSVVRDFFRQLEPDEERMRVVVNFIAAIEDALDRTVAIIPSALAKGSYRRVHDIVRVIEA